MAESIRLYVGNLPYTAQRADIEELFANNEIALKNIDMSIDPFTGRNPSYCFCDLVSTDDAQRAMDVLPGQFVRDRPVKVNFKTEKRARDNRLPTKVYDQGWKPREVETPNVRGNTFAFDRWTRDDAESHWTAPQEEQRRLFIGGLPRIPNQDVLNAEIRHLFNGFEVQAVSKMISPRENMPQQPGSHYYCFVDLPTAQDAQDAVRTLNRKVTPYGGTYKISLARQKKPTIVQREQLGVRELPGNGEQKRRDLSGNWRRQD